MNELQYKEASFIDYKFSSDDDDESWAKLILTKRIDEAFVEKLKVDSIFAKAPEITSEIETNENAKKV